MGYDENVCSLSEKINNALEFNNYERMWLTTLHKH